MKIEARIFELLTAFFFIGGVVYTICTHFSSRGVEWAGVTAMFFSGGLTLLAGTYFRFVARR
ncbi:cytochrome c oxidase subunit 4, partial [uncultured Gordonia sp.]